mmetsp:Transcript_23683/g.35962  ORF Transcript_23683/g.35962 Transcript_23683/m.35962 type:complete len:147 (+) Transcript_23683:1303-1743(+)
MFFKTLTENFKLTSLKVTPLTPFSRTLLTPSALRSRTSNGPNHNVTPTNVSLPTIGQTTAPPFPTAHLMTLILKTHYKEALSNLYMADILEEYVNIMKTLLDDGTLKHFNSIPIKTIHYHSLPPPKHTASLTRQRYYRPPTIPSLP